MKKIMFNDKYGLTQAVLEGRKTMTRRIMTPQPTWVNGDGHIYNDSKPSKYKVGDVVDVAQSYKDTGNYPESYIIDEFHPNIEFEAGWNNKMFVRADLMPYKIRITNVRVERLQDISGDDCLREGILKKSNFPHKKSYPFYFNGGKHSWNNSFSTPRNAFAALVDKVCGKGTWKANPYVFVYEFKLVK